MKQRTSVNYYNLDRKLTEHGAKTSIYIHTLGGKCPLMVLWIAASLAPIPSSNHSPSNAVSVENLECQKKVERAFSQNLGFPNLANDEVGERKELSEKSCLQIFPINPEILRHKVKINVTYTRYLWVN